jgi:hypothetical protein
VPTGTWLRAEGGSGGEDSIGNLFFEEKILPHPPHRQLREVIVFQEQRCISSHLWDQVCKTLVQEPKIHLYDPHFSGQQL